jgi:hypothetical protein
MAHNRPQRRGKAIPIVIVVLILLVAGAMVMLAFSEAGGGYRVNERESVRYSGDANEQTARALAAKLQEIGYFDGRARRDVWIRRGPQGTIVSFMVVAPVSEAQQNHYRTIGRQLQGDFGPTLSVRLIDQNQQEIQSLEL